MKQWSLDARSWRQARPPLEELRKTIVEMRGPRRCSSGETRILVRLG